MLRPAICAALAALAAATAANASTLRVWSPGQVTIATHQDLGVYRTTVLAPAAYRLDSRLAAGTHIGTAAVNVVTAEGPLTFTGWIEKASVAGFTPDNCAADAGYAHVGVWLLEVRQTDGLARAEIPVYLDAGPAGTTALTYCASSAADMTVTGVTLTTTALLDPVVHARYTWWALFDATHTTKTKAVAHG